MLIDGLFNSRGLTLQKLHVQKKIFSASIKDETGTVLFEMNNIEAPEFWSQQAINIVASKYFWKGEDGKGIETSVYDLVDRVASAITQSGLVQGYLDEESSKTFYEELSVALLSQYVAFNSPVWFNVGVHQKPQCSACFINSVEDNMESITDLAKTEMLLFKYGSGTGTNLSTLRSSKEWSKKGGFRSSGPVSFMKGYDAFAGVIKSGGKTRRAAKMVILNSNHPDIKEFVNCKTEEEKKARALIKMGYSAEFNKPGGAYDSVSYQNANHSVRVDDDFMIAVQDDKEYALLGILDGKVTERIRAKGLWKMICESAWQCGDPGIQFDTEINRMHTCKNSGRINASNPCSEYMFLDDSACNLASINLMHFFEKDLRDIYQAFKHEEFCHLVSLMIIAMDILVDMSSYPSKKIANNSTKFRPLGLGYANLGALLMSFGIAYDSNEACEFTNFITGMMTSQAYLQSAMIAKEIGACNGFEENKQSFIDVLEEHRGGVRYNRIDRSGEIINRSSIRANDPRQKIWHTTIAFARASGIRNSQISVIAPTGTIAFMMDCDTTGIEPDLALIKTKKLVGGGTMQIINKSVEGALKRWGVETEKIKTIIDGLPGSGGNIEPLLKKCGLVQLAEIFDCAYPAPGSKRCIRWEAHLNIMAAAQPYISGAISKTVNVPENMTVEQIGEVYMLAWRLGLKSVALYREGCKQSQPLSSGGTAEQKELGVQPINPPVGGQLPARKKLPNERAAIAHKFSVGGHKGYLHVGLYDDGTPGELFITIAKEGSTVSGLLDTIATLTSISLQHGVSLETLISKFRGQKFEPSGFTDNPDIHIASSITDYIFRWMGHKFIKNFEPKKELKFEIHESSEIPENKVVMVSGKKIVSTITLDAPPCPQCGTITLRAGTCHTCPQCGTSTGCAG